MPATRLLLFGTPVLTRGVREVVPLPQRHRVALLALLATAPSCALSRDKLVALLWPEYEKTRARNLLNVAVHGIRRVLEDGALQSLGDDLFLAREQLAVDTWELEAALERGDHATAAILYRGPFLDGFFLSGSQEFERWQERVRGTLASRYCEAIEERAAGATTRGAHHEAVQWYRRLVNEDPLNTRVVVKLLLAMERAGDGPNALHVARTHEALLRSELDIAPDPALGDVVRRLHQRPRSGLPLAGVSGEHATGRVNLADRD